LLEVERIEAQGNALGEALWHGPKGLTLKQQRAGRPRNVDQSRDAISNCGVNAEKSGKNAGVRGK
jgi:hypothetical protein